MVAYCKSKEIQFDSVRFLHDGERLNPEDTAETRELVDNECLQAVLEQTGGNGTPQPEPQPEESKFIEVKVKDQSVCCPSHNPPKCKRDMLTVLLMGRRTRQVDYFVF